MAGGRGWDRVWTSLSCKVGEYPCLLKSAKWLKQPVGTKKAGSQPQRWLHTCLYQRYGDTASTCVYSMIGTYCSERASTRAGRLSCCPRKTISSISKWKMKLNLCLFLKMQSEKWTCPMFQNSFSSIPNQKLLDTELENSRILLTKTFNLQAFNQLLIVTSKHLLLKSRE